MHLTAVFTAPPQFTVLYGRSEIGRTDPSLLTERVNGPRRLLLGGRSWVVTYIDWLRKRCFVEPVDGAEKRSGAVPGSAPVHRSKCRGRYAKCCWGQIRPSDSHSRRSGP